MAAAHANAAAFQLSTLSVTWFAELLCNLKEKNTHQQWRRKRWETEGQGLELPIHDNKLYL